MTYDMAAVTPWNSNTEGALFALTSGKGVCRHYAALFTALARADGIPTADIWGSWPGTQVTSGPVVDDGNNKHNWVQSYIPNYGWIPADPTAGQNWFAQLSDNYHVPVMSVNYVYQRAWSNSPGNFNSYLAEEPVVTQGFQGPGLSSTATSATGPSAITIETADLPAVIGRFSTKS